MPSISCHLKRPVRVYRTYTIHVHVSARSFTQQWVVNRMGSPQPMPVDEKTYSIWVGTGVSTEQHVVIQLPTIKMTERYPDEDNVEKPRMQTIRSGNEMFLGNLKWVRFQCR